MKINKQKHGKENTIGKIIYGFLMFMPLMAILVTCTYVIFNKNAYQSYSGKNDIAYDNINSFDEIQNDKVYHLDTSNGTYTSANTTNSGLIGYEDLTNLNYPDSVLVDYLNRGSYFRLYYNTQPVSMYVFDDTNTQIGSRTLSTYTLSFDFKLISFVPNELQQNYSFLSIYKTNNTFYMDNVFYYSINKVEQSPLFSWATNTGTHDVLESTCQTLGITTPFVPMLLAYWLMMSLMYLLYDIALLIVHMAHNRIHDIESSI